jgi:hypothetical protein
LKFNVISINQFSSVPVYDGREKGFNLGRWWNSKNEYNKPLLVGSAVMVFFTVHGYDYAGRQVQMEGLDTALSFNVLSVVLISDSWDEVKSSKYEALDASLSLGVDKKHSVTELDTYTDTIV